MRSAFFAALLMFMAWAVCPGVSEAAAKQPHMQPASTQDAGSSFELDVPPQLEVWKGWVLHDNKEYFCPAVGNNPKDKVCMFPTSIAIEVTGGGFAGKTGGARFEMLVHAYEKGTVSLPYVAQAPVAWPQEVAVNDAPGLVQDANGRPTLQLAPGEWRITGELSWSEAPEVLQLPENAALVRLSRNGSNVSFPDLSPGGRLRLADKADEGDAKRPEDAYSVRIFRLVEDTLPMRVTTLLRVDVSGRARRVHLENVLPEGGVPLQVNSPLPLSFSGKQGVYLQVRPGSFDVRITSRLEGPVESLGPVNAPYGMEFWAFASQDALRVVEVQGVPGVDPQTTDMPKDWQRYPAYMVEPGATVSFKEMHRGAPESMPDRLSIERTIWLDFDGTGASVRDTINGKVHSDWTLAMLRPGDLGRATMRGKDQPVVMLAGDVDDRARLPGVELRHSDVELTAESCYEGVFGSLGGTLPVTGWDREFDNVTAFLHLPPGWRLLTASGMDYVDASWFSRWSLLDIFLCLVIVLAIVKLRSPVPGLAALVLLALSWQEPGAPRQVWLFLLAALALYKLFSNYERLAAYAAGRRIALWCYSVAMVAMVVVAVPFIYTQISWGLFPQLEDSHYGSGVRYDAVMLQEQAMAPEPSADMAEEMNVESYSVGSMAKRSAPAPARMAGNGAVSKPKAPALMYDPEALVQTGPGLPDWTWRGVELRWSGPVAKAETMHFVLLSPGWNLALSIIRVLLLLFVLFKLLDLRAFRMTPVGGATSKTAAAAAAVLLLLFAAQPAMAVRPAQQQQQQQQAQVLPSPVIGQEGEGGGLFPPKSMLDELQQRLLEPASCFPSCLSSPRMRLRLEGGGLWLMVEVHSGAHTAAPLPRVSDRWTPETVLVDDAPATDIFRNGEDLYVALEPGVHRVVLAGPTPEGLSFQVSFPLQSRQGAVEATGWSVQGLGQAGELEGSLRLARNKEAAGFAAKEVAPERETYRIPPFMKVERVITLGLEWEARTVVRRVSPPGEPVHLEVPLLAGESVLSEDVRVKDGKAVVQLSPGQGEIVWESRLEKAPVLTLTAPEDVPWVETWQLVPSHIWHLDIKGIPSVDKLAADGSWRPTWRPWPGESVNVDVSRPQAAPGKSMTIEKVQLTQRVGQRLDENELLFSIRSSKGGRHTIALPEDAELTGLTASGRDLPLVSAAPGEVEFPVQPGTQDVVVRWRQPRDGMVAVSPPAVNLKHGAVNANVTVEMPQDRWILWTSGGPLLGPAVQYWTYLFAALVFALGLGALPWTRLARWQWFLLAVGLSQLDPIPAMIAVAWLPLLGLRREHYPEKGWFSFDVLQLVLLGMVTAGLVALYFAVERGLLGLPAMQVAGNGSYDGMLQWTADRVNETLPVPTVYSAPLWCFRVVMLAWSLWLAVSLLSWLRWGWDCFSTGGVMRSAKMPQHRGLKKHRQPVDAAVASQDNDFQLEDAPGKDE